MKFLKIMDDIINASVLFSPFSFLLAATPEGFRRGESADVRHQLVRYRCMILNSERQKVNRMM